jgi:hypothetical protein
MLCKKVVEYCALRIRYQLQVAAPAQIGMKFLKNRRAMFQYEVAESLGGRGLRAAIQRYHVPGASDGGFIDI